MSTLFGTDGIRGVAGEFPLDERSIAAIGRSLADLFKETSGRSPRFITGRDTRESGEWIEARIHVGAKSNDAHCESAGVMTTPGVAFLTSKLNFDAGIVVSASHNPYLDNGIKVFLPDGRKMNKAMERAVENDLLDARGVDVSSLQKPARSKGVIRELDKFQKIYLEHFLKSFPKLSLASLKIVMDSANGAASSLAPKLFKMLGADVTAIHNRPNGKNINLNCGSLHLEVLQAAVLENKADFGVAFDGDADRALFSDENGEIVDGDATLWIMSQHLKKQGKLANDTVVATVMSNLGLEIALKSSGIKLLRTPVGDKHVLGELLKTGGSIGGEQSGHIIFPEKSLVGDGMMTALSVLETIVKSGKPLSELTEGFTRYPQILINIKVREKIPFADVKEIAEAARQIENELDGEGRLLLRYSGTENLARVMIEGREQAEIERQANYLAGVIRQQLG